MEKINKSIMQKHHEAVMAVKRVARRLDIPFEGVLDEDLAFDLLSFAMNCSEERKLAKECENAAEKVRQYLAS